MAYSYSEALRAVEKAIDSSLAVFTAYEGVPLDNPPVVLYQQCTFTEQAPDDREQCKDLFKEKFQCLLVIVGESNKGFGPLRDHVALIRDLFKKGNLFTEGNTRVLVEYTPRIAGKNIINGRPVLTVVVSFRAYPAP